MSSRPPSRKRRPTVWSTASLRLALGILRDVQIPDPNPQVVPANSNNDQIVLQVLPGGAYKINSEDVPKDRLFARLKEIYDPRPDKIIFVKGDTSVVYQDVIHAMDLARGAGVKVIGVPPK